MTLLLSFFRLYRRQTVVMLLAIIMAGLAESIGLVTLSPFLSVVVQGNSGASAAAATGGSSQAVRIVYDSLAYFGLEPRPGILLAIIIFTVLVKCVLVLFSKKQVGYTVAHIATDLRLNLIRALLAARWEYYVRQPVGKLANAVATEAMRASQAYLCATTMTAMVFQAAIYLVVALLVSWEITLVALVVAVLLLFLLNRLVKKSRRAGLRQTDLLQLLLAQMIDSLQSIKPLKVMAREELADTILVRQTRRLNKALRQQVYSKAALKALQEPMVTLVMVVGLYVALAFFHMKMAEVMVLIFLLAKFLQQLSKVQQQFQKMVIYESAYWSLLDKITEARRESEIADGACQPVLENSICFHEVGFAYVETPILERVDIAFPVGTITALTGPSGAGKTTILDLITRLCRPGTGKITVDDVLLADIDLRSWRKMIGYVPQEPLLLNDSVKLNVTFGDPDIGETEVVQALKAAGAWEFVSAMSDGLQANVGERGERLSGGQRQRLAIARALVQKPQLLILDEITSALDQASEADICRTLEALKGGLTVIIVSHQPALVAIADQTYRLESGRVELLTGCSEA